MHAQRSARSQLNCRPEEGRRQHPPARRTVGTICSGHRASRGGCGSDSTTHCHAEIGSPSTMTHSNPASTWSVGRAKSVFAEKETESASWNLGIAMAFGLWFFPVFCCTMTGTCLAIQHGYGNLSNNWNRNRAALQRYALLQPNFAPGAQGLRNTVRLLHLLQLHHSCMTRRRVKAPDLRSSRHLQRE